MSRIGKREKIILAVMGIVILYGAYSFFFDSSSGSSKQKPNVSKKEELARIDALVTTASVTLKESKISPVDSYILEYAQKEWANDPFYTGDTSEKEKKNEAEVKNFFYTGFVEHEGAKLAIINGVDYRIGDSLETPGFTLVSIDPFEVVIEDKEGQRKIVVPFIDQ